ncbi:MAG: NUDIX hydrolase, partial [Algoriphagus sp. 32-45-6]
MRIFVNDKPLDLLSYEELDPNKTFEHVFSEIEELPADIEWEEDVLFYEPTDHVIIRLLYLMRTRKMRNLDSVTLVTKDKKALK